MAARLPRFFDNDRPTVIYNPHFDPEFSSWPLVGMDVLDFFARSTRYNLIFAPHVRLFHPPLPEKYAPFRRFMDMPNMHIDLGSVRSIDMSRSEEHRSELQSLMRISYAVLCLKKTTKYVQ